jgi:adenine-specific DNA-methyltransferase
VSPEQSHEGLVFASELTETDGKEASDLRPFLDNLTRWYLHAGDCRDFIEALPDESVQLVITSPPYNIGKKYEKKTRIEEYLALQADVIEKCARVLSSSGSICWQVGNHMRGRNEILPLDIPIYGIFDSLGFKLRNRIVWHFEHGLHCQNRFSGRYEVLLWFTKSDDYTFNVDEVRVPQKYPGKRYFKGPKVGELSGNPLGKNPSDVWVFPNVKHNHPEKTSHPCQFPVELADRMVLATTRPGDIVMDPFAGVSSTICAALLRGRRGCGAEIIPEYVNISKQRIQQALNSTLPVRPTGKPVYQPRKEKSARLPAEFAEARSNGDSRDL